MSLIPCASVLHCLEHAEAVGGRLALTRAGVILSKQAVISEWGGPLREELLKELIIRTFCNVFYMTVAGQSHLECSLDHTVRCPDMMLFQITAVKEMHWLSIFRITWLLILSDIQFGYCYIW